MSNYNSLKATIDANIKQNGRQEITGQILNSVLNQMVNILGTGYQFAGVATLDPATDPGTPDAKVFYIANGKGTYTNFGGLEVTEDDVVVLYYDTEWHKVSTGIASQAKLSELGQKVDGPYTDRAEINNILVELYIDGFQDGYYFSYFTWNGTVVIAIIRDANDNIVWFANGVAATAGAVFQYSQNGVTVYAIFNSNTHLISPQTTNILVKALDISRNPKIFDYLLASKMPNTPIDNLPTNGSNNLVKSGGVYSALNPPYTDRDELNVIFDELYITGLQSGYYFSYFIWNGTVVIAIIRDANDNIVWFANEEPAVEGSIFKYSQGGVTLYAIFNSNTHTISPQDTNILRKALDLGSNPTISEYILTPNNLYSPLCVSRFDQNELLPNGQYNGSWIGITRRCDNINDSVFCFVNKMASGVSNKFFDFYAVGTHTKGEEFVSTMSSYIDFVAKNSLPTSDALLLPIIVGAVNNADGDNLTKKWFTGGNHAYGNTSTGSPTLRELSNTVMVDGKLVPIGGQNVRGRVCTIDVINNIQGYNTCKENGGGREIIQQRAHIEVTNTYIETTIEFVALEEVVVYGPMYATGINVREMPGYRFLGSQSKRGQYVFNNDGNVPASDDNKINAIRILCDGGYIFDTEMDLSYGLGNKLISGEANCFVTISGKAYFEIMSSTAQIHLDTNESIIYRTRMYFRK